MRIHKHLLLSFLFLALTGCGDDDDDDVAPVAAAPAPQAPAPVAPGPTAPDGSPLLITGGSFASEAVTGTSSRHGGRACSIYELTMQQQQQLISRQKVYENNDCSGAMLGEIVLTGTVTELQPEITGAHQFSMAVQSVTMIPHSVLWTQTYGNGNTNSGDCQTELMPLHSENNVAGKTCGPLGTFPSVGDVFHSQYRFEGQNVLMMTYTPYELPNNVSGAEEPAAPRATRMNVRFVRAGSNGTDTGTTTATSTDTSTVTDTSTATDTSVGTGTDTSTDTMTNTATSTDTSTNTVTIVE